MKEIDNDKRKSSKERIEAIQKKQKQQEYKHIGSEKPLKGHTLFEINTKTLKVAPAEFELNKTITWFEALQIQSGTFQYKVLVKMNCSYVSALNESTALARYRSGKGSAIKPKGSGLSIKMH